MKNTYPITCLFCAAIAAVGVLSGVSQAADISWGTPTQISGVSDVSTTGTLVGAFNVAPGPGTPSTTINGVLFQGYNAPSGTGAAASGGATFTMMPGGGGVFGSNSSTSANPPYAAQPVNYQTMLMSFVTPLFDPVTLTISGLIAGAQYQFQFWNNNSSDSFSYTLTATGGNNSVMTASNDDHSDGGLGEWVIGTFTADPSGMQSIRFIGDGDGGFLNGFQLRNVTPRAPGVPDSGSTIALLGCALSGIAFTRRKLRF